ncbi:type IV secretory system conjugative DNA transfer family protein [Rathayibacter tanaceti]|uniref:Type IV secretory system Conjugative DNA transfer n=2 Tax=Rathayibacter tanaceti TaxID=1671680 RepID=A0A166IL72_9MICO|nr:Type IV secretory system Conjugative DNA transfer [Rathayibacter tanaceti]QHC54761.1 type IV secretory system conjugative DNA transfer family protein [Rathayibacter tanaceti]TCO37419.1 type IV secretory system conjugative DNA transfer VirD4/TraG family protein [Rathayibacter tanaceti]
MLYASFEDMMLLIAGPRVGTSTSLVIPAIMAAPGAVVTTSNKRDVLDATRDVRAAKGHVWVFDPQRVAFEDATWWWNALSYVTDDTKAAKLATHFASGTPAMNAKTDAYFDGKGQELLSDLLLAAAAGNPLRSAEVIFSSSGCAAMAGQPHASARGGTGADRPVARQLRLTHRSGAGR